MGHEKSKARTIALAAALMATMSCGRLEELLATPTPTPTNTPTPTPTRTPTPTPTSTSTNTPTATPTPLPDISRAVVKLDDLPSGFEEIPPEELGLTNEALSGEEFQAETLFAFLEPDRLEFVIGSTTLLLTRLEQAGFDIALARPEALTDSFVEGFGATDIVEQAELDQMSGIGDASAGSTVVARVQNLPMRIDVAVFRRDIVGAFVVAMYLDGDEPVVTVEEVARRLDARIVEVLPPED